MRTPLPLNLTGKVSIFRSLTVIRLLAVIILNKISIWVHSIVPFNLFFELPIFIFKYLYSIVQFIYLLKITFNSIFLSLLDCSMLLGIIWSIIRMMFEAISFSSPLWAAGKSTLNSSFSTHRLRICQYSTWCAFCWFIIIWLVICCIYLFRHFGIRLVSSASSIIYIIYYALVSTNSMILERSYCSVSLILNISYLPLRIYFSSTPRTIWSYCSRNKGELQVQILRILFYQ